MLFFSYSILSIFQKIPEKRQKPAYFYHISFRLFYLNIFIMCGAWRKYLDLMHKWHFAECLSWSTYEKCLNFSKKWTLQNLHFLLFPKLYEENSPFYSPRSTFLLKNKKKLGISLPFGLLRKNLFWKSLILIACRAVKVMCRRLQLRYWNWK